MVPGTDVACTTCFSFTGMGGEAAWSAVSLTSSMVLVTGAAATAGGGRVTPQHPGVGAAKRGARTPGRPHSQLRGCPGPAVPPQHVTSSAAGRAVFFQPIRTQWKGGVVASRPLSPARGPRPTAGATPPRARRHRPPLLPMRCRPLPPAAWGGGPAKSGVPRRSPRPTLAGGWNASSPRRHSQAGMASRASTGACQQRLSPQPAPSASAAGARPLVHTKDGAGAVPPSCLTTTRTAPSLALSARPVGASRSQPRAVARLRVPPAMPACAQRQPPPPPSARRNGPSQRGVCYDWPQQPPPARRAIPMGVA